MTGVARVSEVRLSNVAGVVLPAGPTFLTRRDAFLCLVIGEAVAWILQPLVRIWQLPDLLLQGAQVAIVVAPLAALGVVYLGVRLGQRWRFSVSASKFVLVGVLNTLVDVAFLNLLMYSFGATKGLLFGLFKALSFGVAVVNSYIWNKHWSFAPKSQKTYPNQIPPSKQFGLFAFLTLMGMALNAAVATSVVHLIEPLPGFSFVQWANIAAGVALVISAVWNFCAYRFLVFTGESARRRYVNYLRGVRRCLVP